MCHFFRSPLSFFSFRDDRWGVIFRRKPDLFFAISKRDREREKVKSIESENPNAFERKSYERERESVCEREREEQEINYMKIHREGEKEGNLSTQN